MKATFKNKIKLWWHCLMYSHRIASFSYKKTGYFWEFKEIWCSDCNPEKLKEVIENLLEVKNA